MHSSNPVLLRRSFVPYKPRLSDRIERAITKTLPAPEFDTEWLTKRYYVGILGDSIVRHDDTEHFYGEYVLISRGHGRGQTCSNATFPWNALERNTTTVRYVRGKSERGKSIIIINATAFIFPL